jgi:hypothetical protein
MDAGERERAIARRIRDVMHYRIAAGGDDAARTNFKARRIVDDRDLLRELSGKLARRG